MSSTPTTTQSNQGLVRFLPELLLAAFVYCLASVEATAAVSDAVSNVYAQAVLIVPDLGTLAIIIIGISAMFGRITWTQALVVAVGIAVASDAAGVYSTITR